MRQTTEFRAHRFKETHTEEMTDHDNTKALRKASRQAELSHINIAALKFGFIFHAV